MKTYADGDVSIDYFEAAALLADWAILQTRGYIDELVLVATGPLSTDSPQSGIVAELKRCEECRIKTLNYTVPD